MTRTPPRVRALAARARELAEAPPETTAAAPVARPGRDLPLIDFVAALTALSVTFALQALVRLGSVSVDVLVPLVRHAVPVSLLAIFVSFAAAGLYEATARAATIRRVLAALAWATSAVAFAGWYWGGGSGPDLILGPGYALAAACILLGRSLYWRRRGRAV